MLWPIKKKYGDALSWGDLIMFTGTVAIEVMGGPPIGFCAGRIDDPDGSDSVLLGPTPEQAAQFPCPVPGNCTTPLGSTTIGLIYVNPEGPFGNADVFASGLQVSGALNVKVLQLFTASSCVQVSDTFARMGFSSKAAVALIGSTYMHSLYLYHRRSATHFISPSFTLGTGGGHAFGKTHGSCPLGAGPNPLADPSNPWPGLCPNGSYTSGFEGPWTTKPFVWDNEYFKNLLRFNWQIKNSTGNHKQFKAEDGPPDIMMLVSDLSLIKHDFFKVYVEEFASNLSSLSYEFARAWCCFYP